PGRRRDAYPSPGELGASRTDKTAATVAQSRLAVHQRCGGAGAECKYRRRLSAAESLPGPTINVQLFYRRASYRLLGQRAVGPDKSVLGHTRLRRVKRDYFARFWMLDSMRSFSFCCARSTHLIAPMKIAPNFPALTLVQFVLLPATQASMLFQRKRFDSKPASDLRSSLLGTHSLIDLAQRQAAKLRFSPQQLVMHSMSV